MSKREKAVFRIGDTVHLKSRGPIMTVIEVIPALLGQGEPSYRCAWHDGQKPQKEIYPQGALVLAEWDKENPSDHST